MSSGNNKWVCKEQCAQCRCIIKERVVKEPECCEDECAEVYEALGSCLQQCLREKCQQRAARKKKCGATNARS